ncbi:hypothetical protein K8Q98_02920 [Candidatus Nomurabacteria bacterium]|nr:hypothetical protein [Candidatus Nomurabacteria bacterium]
MTQEESKESGLIPILYAVCIVGIAVIIGSLNLLDSTHQKIQQADQYMNENYPFPTAVVVGYAFGMWVTRW